MNSKTIKKTQKPKLTLPVNKMNKDYKTPIPKMNKSVMFSTNTSKNSKLKVTQISLLNEVTRNGFSGNYNKTFHLKFLTGEATKYKTRPTIKFNKSTTFGNSPTEHLDSMVEK